MTGFWRWWYRLGMPHQFYDMSGRWLPWLGTGGLLLAALALVWALVWAPADYQQGQGFRIMYVHVPVAWMSMFVYASMAVSALVALVWRVRMAEVALVAAAPLGAVFTLLALATGALWGKPMWGAWWVWDARLTSELILLFVYVAIMALHHAMAGMASAGRAVSLLTLVGVVNLPIIHYSVVWWNTLHQAASVSKLGAPSIHVDMLWPLLLMALAMTLVYAWLLLVRMRTQLLREDVDAGWVRALVNRESS